MHGPTKRRNVSTEVQGNDKKRQRTRARGPRGSSALAVASEPNTQQQRRGPKNGDRRRKQLGGGGHGQPTIREPSPASSGLVGEDDEEPSQERFDRLMKQLDSTYNNGEYAKCIKAGKALLKLPATILHQDWGIRRWGGALEQYNPGYRVVDGIRETLIVCHTESGQYQSAVRICTSVIFDKDAPASTRALAVTQKIDCLLNAERICEAYTFALKQDDEGVKRRNEVYQELQKCFPWFVGLARIKYAFRELQDAAVNAREALQIAGKRLDQEPTCWVLWCYLIIAEAASELKPTKENLRQALKWWKKAIDMERRHPKSASTTERGSMCRIQCLTRLIGILEAYGNNIGEKMASYLLERVRGLHDELTAEFNTMSNIPADDCVLELRASKLFLCGLSKEGKLAEQKRTVVIDCSSGGVAMYLTRSLTPNCTWVYESPAGDPGMGHGLKALIALRPVRARDELTVYRLPSSTPSVKVRAPRGGRREGISEDDLAPRLGFGEVYEDLTDSYGHGALLQAYVHNHGENHRSSVFDTDAVQILPMPPERVAKDGLFRVVAARDVAVGERIFVCDGIIRALSPAQLGQADPATVMPLRDLPKGAFGFWVNPKTMKYLAVQGELPDLRVSKKARKNEDSGPVDIEGLDDITTIFGLSRKLTQMILLLLKEPTRYGELVKLFHGIHRLPRDEDFYRGVWKLAVRYKLCDSMSSGRCPAVEPDDEDYIPSLESPEAAAWQVVFSEDEDLMSLAIRRLRQYCNSFEPYTFPPLPSSPSPG